MSRPSFLFGVIVAVALSFIASAVIATLTPFVGVAAVWRLLVPLLALAYLVLLFRHCDERLGRVTTLTAWLLLAVVTWWFAPPAPVYLLIHVTAIWLIRSLYFYAGLVPALLDFGLTALSVCAAVWAAVHTGSLFAAVWCFFLGQALFVAIPRSIRRDHSTSVDTEVRFDTAERRAEAALQRLYSR